MTGAARPPKDSLSNRALMVWCAGVLSLGLWCPAPTEPHAALHQRGLTNAECMAHDPHWSTVVTYWADTTMTTIAHADTACSITGPVAPPTVGIGGHASHGP